MFNSGLIVILVRSADDYRTMSLYSSPRTVARSCPKRKEGHITCRSLTHRQTLIAYRHYDCITLTLINHFQVLINGSVIQVALMDAILSLFPLSPILLRPYSRLPWCHDTVGIQCILDSLTQPHNRITIPVVRICNLQPTY